VQRQDAGDGEHHRAYDQWQGSGDDQDEGRAMKWAAPVVAAALFPGAVAAENTPDGPATLVSHSGAPVTAGRVVTSWTLTVGRGGHAGIVRPLLGGVAGEPVQLPATPGAYTFALAHTAAGPEGLIQETGGLAIVTREPCRPTIARALDPCETKWLDIKQAGHEDIRDRGAQLAVAFNSEPDVDGDLRGDLTEDRTDLRVSAVPERGRDGRLRVDVTLTNAGGLSADRPSLDVSWLANARVEGACVGVFPQCVTTPLGPGESRSFVIRAEDPDATSVTVSTRSEGTDVAPADNSTVAGFLPAPPYDLAVADRQRLSRGVRVRVRGVAAGPARVTAAFKIRGHTFKLARTVELTPYVARTVTLRATGATLRSLRRHAPLEAALAVEGPAVTASTTVR
jgi:hypothetical protein